MSEDGDGKLGEKAKGGSAARLVACPRCRKNTRYELTNPNRPFCSARCKNEDIVSWAQEGYRIQGPALDPDEKEGMPDDAGGEDEG